MRATARPSSRRTAPRSSATSTSSSRASASSPSARVTRRGRWCGRPFNASHESRDRARARRLQRVIRPGNVDAPMTVTDRLRTDFTAWCRDKLFTPEVREATRLVNRYCDLQLTDVYRELGLGDRLQTPKSAAALAQELGFVDTASITLRDMLRRLGERTGIVNVEGPPLEATYVSAKNPEDPQPELAKVRAAIAK